MSIQVLKNLRTCSKFLFSLTRSPTCHRSLVAVRFCSTKEGKTPRPDSMGGDRGTKVKKSPITWVNFAITAGLGVILFVSYKYAVYLKEKERAVTRRREIGKAKIGGNFELVDQNGQPKTSSDFFGKWILLYFGFTHCPDICPDEIEKLCKAYDGLKADRKKNPKIGEVVPLFITVDPERDGVKEVGEYVKEFHPDLIGLTGTQEKVLEACKAFRVYYSAGPRDESDDYIVDHTIIIYLIDPDGQFVDYYGQTKTAEQVETSVKYHMLKRSSI